MRSAATALPGTIETARKGYTAWSRKVQYAALRPRKGGGAILGLAVPLEGGLEAAKNEGWSERLTAKIARAEPKISPDLMAYSRRRRRNLNLEGGRLVRHLP